MIALLFLIASIPFKIFCDSLNEVHPNIKFTTKIHNNISINFLDVSVHSSSTTVATSTFRKLTNTGLWCTRTALYHEKAALFNSSDGRVVWSVCLLSCRLGFDSESGQTNDFKIGIHSFPA